MPWDEFKNKVVMTAEEVEQRFRALGVACSLHIL